MDKVILITGGFGLVGTALKKILPNAIYISSKDYNLTRENDVIKMFDKYKPNIVIHLAAKVGGILDNIEKPAEYFVENVLMNSLMVKYSYEYKVDRFITMLSSCIYPDYMDVYPLKEDDLHKGPPTISNFSYGYAKRCLAVQIDSYNKQYGTKYNYVIPCNLYGIGDKDDGNKSHFVTALIKKIYEANKNGDKSITLMGDGTPLRQFMLADDLAYVVKKMIEENIYENFNVTSNENYSISEIAKIALKACDSEYLDITYDKSKPNGQYRKDISNDKIKTLLPNFKPTSLSTGIKKIYENYLLNDKIS
jgi:GDP-L-fucose synthase